MHEMLKFPAESIGATAARYSSQSGPSGLASISIWLAPFEFDGSTHDTSLRCDQIELDLDDFSALGGRRFEFPPNPEPGHIDGSLYLFGVHVLFITKTISFGKIGRDTIPLRIDGMLELSSDRRTRYEDADLSVETALYLPLTPERLVSIATHAIDATNARLPRDLGKAMALLAKDPRADGWMAELSVEVRRILQARAASASQY